MLDIATQASLYVDFLTALGGVAITALTLVLALDRGRVDQRVFQMLPAALIAATLAAFAGAHLMVAAASLREAVPAADVLHDAAEGLRTTARLYLIAGSTTASANGLFFCLVLLPAVYDVQGPTELAQRLALWA